MPAHAAHASHSAHTGHSDSSTSQRPHLPTIIIAAGGLGLLIGWLAISLFVHFATPHGELHLDTTINSDTRSRLSTLLADLELWEDLTVSTELTPTAKDGVLLNVYLPVTGFYNPISSLSTEEFTTLTTSFTTNHSDSAADATNPATLPAPDSTAITLVPLAGLTADLKLLAVDGQYYLDTLNSGALFEYLTFSGNPETVTTAKTLAQPLNLATPTADTTLTLAQTGVTALSRGMYSKLQQVGDGSYFAAHLADYLSRFDLTHTSNEASFTDAANSENICSNPAMLDALTSIGLDIVELTGNHNHDCGDEAALTTLNLYHSLGIRTVGGGATADDAAQPLEINADGAHLTLLAYNLSTGGYTTDNTPGANLYTEEKAKSDIAAAKARGDFIIVDVQYYECNAYASTYEDPTCDYADSAAGDQIGFFRHLIDLGADLVVGTAAHQPQTYELYGDGAIYYGLGNLFFDQIWWPGTTRSLILVHYFWQGQHLQTRIVPTVYDDTYQTALMDSASATEFLHRLNSARPSL